MLTCQPRRYIRILLSYCALAILIQASYRDELQIARNKPNGCIEEQSISFWISRYLQWHSLNRYNGTRSVVYQTNRGGIGDNVRAMLDVYALAVLTQRLFLIDMRKPYPISILVSESSQKRFIVNDTRLDAAVKEKKPWIASLKLPNDAANAPKLMLKLLREGTNTVVLNSGPRVTSAALNAELAELKIRNSQSSPPRFSQMTQRAITRSLLEPSLALSMSFNATLSRLQLCIDNIYCPSGSSRYVAVHARLGGGVGEGNHRRFAFIKGSEEKLAKCYAREVGKIARIAKLREPVVYIATDTLTFRPTLHRHLVQEIQNVRVVHLQQDVRHINRIPVGTAVGLDIFKSQHEEMLLLGHATHIVAMWSGFSRAAFWRGNAEKLKYITKDGCRLK